PVDLELGLARAAGADAAGLLAQLDAATAEPREPIAQLRQLHLHHAFLAASVLGEDVEDQRDAVDDIAAELLLEVALLRGRERVGQSAQLVGLAGADVRGGVRGRAPLEHRLDRSGAGGVGQQPELGEARFRLVQRVRARSGADEKRALLDDTEVDLGGGEAAALASLAIAHATLTSVSKTCVTGPCSRIVSARSTSCVPPRTCTITCSPTRPRRWATAADAHTPVPHESVSPTPRSHTRMVSSSGPVTVMNSTLVRCGKRSSVSRCGPCWTTRVVSGSSTSSTKCGLPMPAASPWYVTPWNVTSRSSALGASSGISAGSNVTGPMSTVAPTSSPVAWSRSSATSRRPAPVSTTSRFPSPIPSRTASQERQPIPFPLISARLPSALRSSIAQSAPSRPGRSVTSPSAPTPRRRSQSRAVTSASGPRSAVPTVTRKS